MPIADLARARRLRAAAVAVLRLRYRQRTVRLRLEPRLPAITRKTDKGLPRYRDAEESDVFILSGAEDLVPAARTDGDAVRRPRARPGSAIHRYRPRIEGLFARIERWTDLGTGDDPLAVDRARNVTTLYGSDARQPRSPTRADRRRVFSWLICESYDDKGNAIVYEYVAGETRTASTDRRPTSATAARHGGREPLPEAHPLRQPRVALDRARPVDATAGSSRSSSTTTRATTRALAGRRRRATRARVAARPGGPGPCGPTRSRATGRASRCAPIAAAGAC